MVPAATEDGTAEAAIEEACEAIDLLQQKLSSDSTRSWLEAQLCDQLRSGSLESLQVVEWARNGDLIADAALRRVYFEMENLDIKPPAIVKAYCLETLARGPLQRGRGHFWFDNFRRDIGVAMLVWLTCEQFGMSPTRNREQKRRAQPSGAHIVAIALGRRNINLTETSVQNIWTKYRNRVLTFAALSGLAPSLGPLGRPKSR